MEEGRVIDLAAFAGRSPEAHAASVRRPHRALPLKRESEYHTLDPRALGPASCNVRGRRAIADHQFSHLKAKPWGDEHEAVSCECASVVGRIPWAINSNLRGNRHWEMRVLFPDMPDCKVYGYLG